MSAMPVRYVFSRPEIYSCIIVELARVQPTPATDATLKSIRGFRDEVMSTREFMGRLVERYYAETTGLCERLARHPQSQSIAARAWSKLEAAATLVDAGEAEQAVAQFQSFMGFLRSALA